MSTDPKKLPRSKMLPFTFFSMPKTEFTALKPILIKKTNKNFTQKISSHFSCSPALANKYKWILKQVVFQYCYTLRLFMSYMCEGVGAELERTNQKQSFGQRVPYYGIL